MWIGDARVARVARLVTDLSHGSLAGLRLLDVACDEGNFANQLAQLGAAEVLGVEARDAVERARERAQEAGLTNTRFEQGDVRAVTAETHGTFDVVLCLGMLYHLDAPDVFEFAENLWGLTDPGGFAIIETQVSLSRPREESFEGRRYWGRSYPEDVSMPGASIDNPQSFWLTRSSLLNLLRHVGFTSVLQVMVPAIPVVDQMVDHVVFVAFRGSPGEFEPPEATLWPERLAPGAHPTQGLRWRLLERARRLTGKSRMRAIFRAR